MKYLLVIIKTAILNLFFLLFLSVFTSCEGIDKFSTNPGHKLRFSVDTLSFDTVFTSIGSATRQFMVYNPNGEALKINTIGLANGGKSGFRINVDGRKGTSFQDIEIWKKDSLYISIEVTVDPNTKNQPFIIEDSVVFYTNGVRQSVLLQAYGQNAHRIKGGKIFSIDTILTADLPYLVYDSMEVKEGATLTLQKGVILYMHNRAKLKIEGTLKALGTQEEPVIIRGDRLDYALVAGIKLPYDLIPGQWDGIYFASTSFENEFDYVIMRNGYGGLTFQESQPDRLKMKIQNSQITNMDYNLLYAVNCHIEASNSEFTLATDSTVALIGGKYQFTHCTMINDKKIRSKLIPSSLILANKYYVGKDEKHVDLVQAFFDNCIIDGSMSADSTKLYRGALSFETRSKEEQEGSESFNYRFRSCLIRTARVNNDRFVNNLYIERPKYRNIPDFKKDFAFDFRLANKSAGIGKADRSIAEQYPVDRYGVNRLTSETGPTVGAYEYVYQEEEKEKKKK